MNHILTNHLGAIEAFGPSQQVGVLQVGLVAGKRKSEPKRECFGQIKIVIFHE